uniref:Uncharacterized protein n=1 Tax=Candidatus Kentrum sp. LFY TaxID=2126342 RepID=A0A450U902_9GAMM|nr:MAG: hypothetical protein BECKLFY1418B_GA0070995_101045 [Candidatus Kentron sp. LFY]VFJ91451.1 MAG: hypothetical protein BECKLFY1418A_GA0070994_101613 [Candidatus Kentron sp. LFY]
MLVIRGDSDVGIRCMNVMGYLRRHGTETRRVIFQGEPIHDAQCGAHEELFVWEGARARAMVIGGLQPIDPSSIKQVYSPSTP